MHSRDMKELRTLKVQAARAAYGHIEGLDDVDMLCLALSNADHQRKERLEALNANAKQAALIALQRREMQNAG